MLLEKESVKILVIDDYSLDRNIVKRLIESGYTKIKEPKLAPKHQYFGWYRQFDKQNKRQHLKQHC